MHWFVNFLRFLVTRYLLAINDENCFVLFTTKAKIQK